MNKKITLPSGSILEISLAPFADANALNRAVAKELLKLKINKDLDFEDPNFIKDLICSAIASDEIMNSLNTCFKRCTYDGLRLNEEVFEKEESRQDYFTVCKEVLTENCRPFVKSLLSQFGATGSEMKA
jgi:hypothetical protein